MSPLSFVNYTCINHHKLRLGYTSSVKFIGRFAPAPGCWYGTSTPRWIELPK